MCKKIILYSFIAAILFACGSNKFPYESSQYEGKSYIGKIQNFTSNFNDSTVISGRMFIKDNKGLKVPSLSKLELISTGRDTIQIRTNFLSGFDLKFPSGSYKLVVHSDNCVSIEIDNFEFKSNKLYLIDFYLQKGQGTSRWTH